LPDHLYKSRVLSSSCFSFLPLLLHPRRRSLSCRRTPLPPLHLYSFHLAMLFATTLHVVCVPSRLALLPELSARRSRLLHGRQ
jgi:hypothetical protein